AVQRVEQDQALAGRDDPGADAVEADVREIVEQLDWTKRLDRQRGQPGSLARKRDTLRTGRGAEPLRRVRHVLAADLHGVGDVRLRVLRSFERLFRRELGGRRSGAAGASAASTLTST